MEEELLKNFWGFSELRGKNARCGAAAGKNGTNSL